MEKKKLIVKVKKPIDSKVQKNTVKSKLQNKSLDSKVQKNTVESSEFLVLTGGPPPIDPGKSSNDYDLRRIRVNLTIPADLHRRLRVYDIQHGDLGLVPTIEAILDEFIK